MHAKDIVHTNFNPNEIFLRDKNLENMSFLNLYYCSWNIQTTIGLYLPDDNDNLSIYDIRMRNKHYISPEQLQLGSDLANIASLHNGKLDESTSEVTDFFQNSRNKINKQCDIYSVGAILYRLLLGSPPSHEISDFIAKNKLNEKTPDSNVYEVPFFFKDYILSNDMCYILIRLLHSNPKHRFTTLDDVKEELLRLRENIYSTPPMLRKILGHPILPNESY